MIFAKQNVEQQLRDEIVELGQSALQGIDGISRAMVFVEDTSQLNQSIKTALREMHIKIHQLELIGDEKEDRYESAHVQEFVQQQRQYCKSLQIKQRQANEEYLRRSRILYERQQREQLFASPTLGHKIGANKNRSTLTHQSKRVTESLASTRKLLSSQLTQLSDSMISLNTQKETLKKTFDEHENISGNVGTTQKLIIWLKLKERWDHYLTLFAFGLFCLLVLSIINKRLFPFWTILWYFVGRVFATIGYALSYIVPSSTPILADQS